MPDACNQAANEIEVDARVESFAGKEPLDRFVVRRQHVTHQRIPSFSLDAAVSLRLASNWPGSTQQRSGNHPLGQDNLAKLVRRYAAGPEKRSEEHTSELQSLMRISYAVFCLKKKK